MQHSIKCRDCENVGTVTIETLPAKGDGHPVLIVTGIDGDFVRSDEVTPEGKPTVRCDKCNAILAAN